MGEQKVYRSPIVVVLGHIDHGKTSVLDRIRQTRIAEGEAGGITQSIGSTFIPMDLISRLCKKMFQKMKIEPTLSGLLFIDTPGHEAFTSMRKRGSHIADIAVLVVDINEGFMPQSMESLHILKETRTPFVIAFNKIDKIYGWKSSSEFLENFSSQADSVKENFEKRFYGLLAELEKQGMKAERFDRVTDFSKEIAAVPVSAKTGEGIPELLFVLTGLAEKFLKPDLVKTGECRGVVLEVKETRGLGTTVDAIVYDGTIRKGDYIAISGKEPVISKIKALLVPRSLQDMRTERKFDYIDGANASCGVRIFASGLTGAVPGSEFVVKESEEQAKQAAASMMEEESSCHAEEGIVLKADTLGAIDALKSVFKDFKIKYGDVGQVNKNDIMNAEINKDPLLRSVISFNSGISEDAESIAKKKGIEIFHSPVIYHLIDEYKKWRDKTRLEIEMEKMKGITLPGKMTVLPGCVFRASKPAILGCEVLGGVIKSDCGVFKVDEHKNEIVSLGKIKQIQSEGIDVEEAKTGDKVAVSITEAVFDRNVKEGDIIYTDISQKDSEILEHFGKILSPDQKIMLSEIKAIKRLR